LEDWKNWTFSDESTIELDCAEGTKRFLIKRNQRYDPQFIQGKRQQGGGKLMIWSRVSWDGIVFGCRVHRIRDRIVHRTVLRNEEDVLLHNISF
jgi:hypothetical protein